ncbi:hypothetical protein SteCoe_19538 [Stentor coeruleus]|uniref:Uncharacterized protein n=1 Tax=Stentor coeruleus TaxID=5963 RepID=A0A1R2BUE3_9CILI|nr:hypothetical protein SteCoe_19538 [Stentor coeruleus]
MENTIEVEIDHDKGFINVIAELPKSSVSPLKEVVYDPTEVLIADRPPHSGRGLLIFWVLATLLLISVATSIYFYKKKKRVENVLNYEMNDVRNVASIPAPGEEKAGIIRKDPYSSLAEAN